METLDTRAVDLPQDTQLFGAYSLSEQQSAEFGEAMIAGEPQRAAQEWGFDTATTNSNPMELYWLWRYTRTMAGTTPALIHDMRKLLEHHHIWNTFLRLTSVCHDDRYHMMYLLWNIVPYLLERSPVAIERLFQSFDYALSELHRQSAILISDGYLEDNISAEQTQRVVDALYDKVTRNVENLTESVFQAGFQSIEDTALDTLAKSITLECDIKVFIARELLQLNKTAHEDFLTTTGMEMLSLDSQTVPCRELSIAQKEALASLYTQSRAELTEKELAIDIADFKDTLNNPDAYIHILTDTDREPVTFVCYEPIDNDIYASALTVNYSVPAAIRGLASVICMNKVLQQIQSCVCLVHKPNTAALNLYNKRLSVEQLGGESIPEKFTDQTGLVALRLTSKQPGTSTT